MASWSSKIGKIIYYPAENMGNGWYQIDCGCCGGMQWGGESPEECNRCEGSGRMWWHKKSKVFAEHPGGKLMGSGELTNIELEGSVK